MPRTMRFAIVAFSCATFIAMGSSATLAVTVTHDFSGTAGTQPVGWNASVVSNTAPASATQFQLDGSGGYTVGGSAGANGLSVVSTAFQIGDRQAGTDFSISTVFNTTAYTASASYNTQTSLRFLATNEVEGGANSHYLLDVSKNNNGDWHLILNRNIAGTNTAVATVIMNGGTILEPFRTDVAAYTLSAVGTYIGSDLKIDFSLSNGSVTRSGTYTDAAPLSGQYFGLRERWRSFTGTMSSSYRFDQFSVTYQAVPEPASLVLLGLGVVGLIVFRRRARSVA